jgi:hypothetical protein
MIVSIRECFAAILQRKTPICRVVEHCGVTRNLRPLKFFTNRCCADIATVGF